MLTRCDVAIGDTNQAVTAADQITNGAVSNGTREHGATVDVNTGMDSPAHARPTRGPEAQQLINAYAVRTHDATPSSGEAELEHIGTPNFGNICYGARRSDLSVFTNGAVLFFRNASHGVFARA